MNLGKLKLGEKLGDGGEGRVFSATDPEGRHCALKVLELDPRADAELLATRLRALYGADPTQAPLVPLLARQALREVPRELRAQIPGEFRDALVMVLPLLDGASLSALAKKEPLTPVEAVVALAALAIRLGELPTGVAHGDVKASNVFVLRSGRVVLIDPALFNEPIPVNDLRDLGKLGKELLGDSATGELGGLLTDLERASTGITLTEASDRLTLIAHSLGAPAANPGTVLMKRVALIARPQVVPNAVPAPHFKPKSHRLRPAAYTLAGLLLIPALLYATAYTRWLFRHRDTVTAFDPIRHGEVTIEPLNHERGQYDTTGTVHYKEPIHELVSNERAERGDALIQARIESYQPRFAINAIDTGEVYVAKEPLVPNTRYWFDAKPGDYEVEIDRTLDDGTIQLDKNPIHVDVHHPFRFRVTKDMSAPPIGEAPSLWERFVSWLNGE